MAKEKQNEVAIVEESTALADLSGFEEFAGAGLENTSAQDINIPYIQFLQSGSPQIKKGNEKRIADAAEGDIVATGINRLYKVDDNGNSSLNVAVVQKITLLSEWAPNRGGLQGHHSMAEKEKLVIKKTKNKDGKEILVLPNGNEIVETDYLFCVAIPTNENETPFFCIMPMAQTKRAAVRQLYTQLTFDCQGALPTFAFVYTIGTAIKTKEEWSWVVPKFTKVTAADGVTFVDSKGILNRRDAKGLKIFETCANLLKTIKSIGIENFLNRNTNDEYEELETGEEAASEVI